MRVDPAIEVFRADASGQRRARLALETALADWREGGAAGEFLRAFARYGDGCPIAQCPALHPALDELGAARALIHPLLGAIGQGLGAHPFAQVPLRYQQTEGHTVLQLASAGRATLSLVRYDRHAQGGAPETVCFTDGERRELCLSGEATATRVVASQVEKTEADLRCMEIVLRPGSRLAFAGGRETKIVDRVAGSLTLLRLSRRADRPTPSHEYRLSDGMLLHRTAGDCRESREELAMAVLGRMKRRDAVPAFLGLAQDRSRSDSLRWQALRECLALDSATGFGALVRIADDRGDPLYAPARSLHGELCARYPQFARDRAPLCPA